MSIPFSQLLREHWSAYLLSLFIGALGSVIGTYMVLGALAMMDEYHNTSFGSAFDGMLPALFGACAVGGGLLNMYFQHCGLLKKYWQSEEDCEPLQDTPSLPSPPAD